MGSGLALVSGVEIGAQPVAGAGGFTNDRLLLIYRSVKEDTNSDRILLFQSPCIDHMGLSMGDNGILYSQGKGSLEPGTLDRTPVHNAHTDLPAHILVDHTMYKALAHTYISFPDNQGMFSKPWMPNLIARTQRGINRA